MSKNKTITAVDLSVTHDPPDSRIATRPHLTRQKIEGSKFDAKHPNEAWCTECMRRVTLNPTTGVEYGHRRFRHRDHETCPHRDPALNPGQLGDHGVTQ
jgi:hypothetical protein